MSRSPIFFFFNDTATPEIYTLSLPAALPISRRPRLHYPPRRVAPGPARRHPADGGVLSIACPRRSHRNPPHRAGRSEEHTSELQSRLHLVCRLLLEKKNKVPK